MSLSAFLKVWVVGFFLIGYLEAYSLEQKVDGKTP